VYEERTKYTQKETIEIETVQGAASRVWQFPLQKLHPGNPQNQQA